MLVKTSQGILKQLYDFTSALGQEKFVRQIPALSGSTIGQHMRHVLEFFSCMVQGYENGEVNYDNRKHDKALEENLGLALLKCKEMSNYIPFLKRDKKLTLLCNYSSDEKKGGIVSIQTVLERELAYNIEHAVHHMAIIKIGASIIAPEISLPKDFGVASSTIKYRESNVHSNFSA